MRNLIIAIVLIFSTLSLRAQMSNPGVFSVANAPAGSCVNGSPIQVVIATGAIYSCAAGTWTEVGVSPDDGFPIVIGSTAIESGSSTSTIAGLTLTSPVFAGPALGTPISGVVTNLTGTGAFNTSGTAGGLTGTPALPNGTTATTQLGTDNTTKIATTAQVQAAIAAAAPVTAVSIASANGVSGSSSGGLTPALTIALGAITPTSTNGVSAATLAFMDATSSIQTQLNAKQASLGFTPARSGANSDITSLSGLTTPLSVAQGGTGTASTLTGIMRGNASAMTAAEISGDCTTSGSNAITCTKTGGSQIAAGLSIPTGTATFAGGTGITSAACASGYSCNNTRGTLTIVAAVGATTGTIVTVSFSATLSAAPACFASQNGGSTAFGIGNSSPTTSAFNITAGISVSLATLTVNYQCQP